MDSAPLPPPAGRRLRVVVADDFPDAAFALSLLLEAWGHDSRPALSAEAALRALADCRPDLILIEPCMPGAHRVAAAVLSGTARGEPRTVLAALSVGGGRASRGEWADMGIRVTFRKPVATAALRRYLDGLKAGGRG